MKYKIDGYEVEFKSEKHQKFVQYLIDRLLESKKITDSYIKLSQMLWDERQRNKK